MARLLLAVYAVLTAYATLYPMDGWRDAGVPAFAYLSAPWRPQALTDTPSKADDVEGRARHPS